MDKLRVYKLLGADFFQKVVFKVEKIKYRIMDLIPNMEAKLDKFTDFQYDLLTFAHKDKKDELDEKRKFAKMRYRKELYTKKNINYHCDMEYPIEFIRQLEFNKGVHMRGLKFNIGALLALLVSYLCFSITLPIVVLLTIQQLFSLFINFECVNLQNYNLERFNSARIRNSFKKKTAKSYINNYQKYGHASEKIEKLVKESSSIPTISDTIDAMETKEEREELLALARRQKKRLVLTRKED